MLLKLEELGIFALNGGTASRIVQIGSALQTGRGYEWTSSLHHVLLVNRSQGSVANALT